MTKAEERAWEAYPYENGMKGLICENSRQLFIQGYEQAEKDTISEVERWLKVNFHHRNCWNADEFCISLRAYFGIKK